ncbi:hypothetical protein L1987_52514 [Smallanthus sonchifolius]|uniref:Uncharacterized protein n=1 Tax=Smallanthus sonchifolius TaxID=185202 RepID=A0ACB9ETQ2_9ASTR|nr:hypothetical protein L1987_52514 [Smallanthus sonchifolius]
METISVSSPTPLNFSQSKENIKPKSLAKVQDEDVMSVIEMMMNRKRKNIVVIRECLASADAIVKGVIEKIETKSNTNLSFMQFVSLPLHSLNHLSKEDVQDKVRELKCLVKSFVGRGVILYLGDLKWVSSYWSDHSERRLSGSYYYTPMEHMIMELSGLMFGVDVGKLWLMGIASSQTYMRCKTGHPSLENLWDLCPVTLPLATLDLTLNLESTDSENEKKFQTCYGECSVNLTREARTITSYGRTSEPIATHESTLPSWMQQYKEENTRQITNNDQECDKFKEMNSENVKVLSNALERVAPWQSEIIPEIVSTVLQCRSGAMKRKGKEETWLTFLGADNHAKEKIARELAKVIFGSRNNFVQMGLSRFSATRAESTDDDQEFVSNKRPRNENGQIYLERFSEAVQEDTNRVFFMEDVEQVDYHSQMGIKKAIKSGRITLNGGETVLLNDAIVIFSCESFSSISRACSPRRYSENEGQETVEDCGKEAVISLDLNIATEDHKSLNEDESAFDVGILDSADNQVIFKLHML